MNIELKGINKAFGEKTIFDNFSATFESGKRYCIMGASGRGKTTLFNLLLGLERVDSGELSGLPKSVSTVFQEDRLCEEFSSIANVQAVTGKKSVGREEIIALLTELGLQDSLDEKAMNLSGGMKRRVALARSLLFDSELLILDEPFKGLDDETRESVANVILSRTKGKTLIFSSHDTKEAELLNAQIFEI